jgi:hypothetical protein
MSDDTNRPTLKEVALMQAEALQDVLALLYSLDSVVSCLASTRSQESIQRLARMASEGVEGVHTALEPYI